MSTMKALNYVGPYTVRVEDIEKPRLEHPDDIIVKVTTVSDRLTRNDLYNQSANNLQAAICGSDLQ